MRFRRKSILFWESQIIVFICMVCGAFLIIYDNMLVPIMLIPLILLICAFGIQMILGKEYIIMNEEGIVCQRGKQMRWKCQWSEIEELKIGNRFRNPSVEIILKKHCYKDKKDVETMDMYFQLGFVAKKAIRIYWTGGRFA